MREVKISDMQKEGEPTQWDAFANASYQELRDIGEDGIWRKWVTSLLTSEDQLKNPMTLLTQFGDTGYTILNSGGKKFSGIMASVIDYYEREGIAEFNGDLNLYVGFLQSAFAFDQNLVAVCLKSNYRSLAVGHTAEHAADTASIIAQFLIEENPREAMKWYQKSLEIRSSAEEIYQKGTESELNIHQLKLNKSARAIQIATQLSTYKYKNKLPIDAVETDLVTNSAICALEVFNYRKINKDAITSSLVLKKGDSEKASQSYERTKSFFETDVILKGVLVLGNRCILQLAKFDLNLVKIWEPIEYTDFRDIFQITAGYVIFAFLLSTGESELISSHRDVGPTFLEILNLTKNMLQLEADVVHSVARFFKNMKRQEPVERARNELMRKPQFRNLRNLLKNALALSRDNQNTFFLNKEEIKKIAGFTGLL